MLCYSWFAKYNIQNQVSLVVDLYPLLNTFLRRKNIKVPTPQHNDLFANCPICKTKSHRQSNNRINEHLQMTF